MGSPNYIPRNHVAFCMWAKGWVAYATENHERWGVEAPDAGFVPNLERLETLSVLCTTPKHTSENIVERNMIRKEVEKEARSYIQGMVAKNKHVTDLDRKSMGIPVRDTKPTPTGDPVGQAEADVVYPGKGQLQLRIRHVDGTPDDPKANTGYRISYSVFAHGETLPVSGRELRENRVTRLKRETFDFDNEDSGKTAVFSIRYENNRGKAGRWGPLIIAIIP